MPLGTEVGLGPGDVVLDGDPAPPLPVKGAQPPFFAHVYCGQTAGWMKTALGTEVDLGPGHIVLDGDRAPPAKDAQQTPVFGLVYCVHGRSSQLLRNCGNVIPLLTQSFKCSLSTFVFVSLLCPLWPPCVADADIIFLSCCFLSFFPRLISTVADWICTILPHMVWP